LNALLFERSIIRIEYLFIEYPPLSLSIEPTILPKDEDMKDRYQLTENVNTIVCDCGCTQAL